MKPHTCENRVDKLLITLAFVDKRIKSSRARPVERQDEEMSSAHAEFVAFFHASHVHAMLDQLSAFDEESTKDLELEHSFL